MGNSHQTVLLVLFTVQDLKQPKAFIVGAVYWTAGCETANRLLLVLFTGQQYLKQRTDCIVGAVYCTADVKQTTECYAGAAYCTARCKTANRLLVVLFTAQHM
jgi:hypothetical protein